MKFFNKFFYSTILCLAFNSEVFAKELIPNVIIAIHNLKEEPKIQLSPSHQLAQMPLNHLGFKVEFHDISKETYPNLDDRPEVRGILSWLENGTRLEEPEKYINWLIKNIKSGKKFVMMGEPAIFTKANNELVKLKLVNELLELIGLRDEENWVDLTYDVRYTRKSHITEFERKYIGYIKPYQQLKVIDRNYTPHLTVKKAGEDWQEADLVVTGPTGGYVSNGYSHYEYYNGTEISVKQWFINPFSFFRLAFQSDDLPKPDATTLNGRRIYYSHIDGDGWNNTTHIEEYQEDPPLSAQVIYDKALKPYPDLPVTVGPIAADLDKEWAARKESSKIAVDIFALPHVELASHTYSHPFHWKYFDKKKRRKIKLPFDKQVKNYSKALKELKDKIIPSNDKPIYENPTYEKPRAYEKKPFDIKNEISGSAKFIERFAPAGKKVKLIQWSGDTSPFEEVLEETRLSGYLNINGGDSRFDREYNSLTWVSPLGRQVGKEWQIYASNSNENTYTDLWTGRYHGFKYLIKTFENTESPYRLKPLNVYYHMYSGERKAALNALIANLEYVRTQKVIPIETSQFIKIVEGFQNSKIYKLSDNSWQVENNGDLQTIRFDYSSTKTVDYKKSKGVIGQRHLQGSLYVFLDKNVENPLITLKDFNNFHAPAILYESYLVDSRWDVWNVKRKGRNTSFYARGYGLGEMTWQVPVKGKYRISFNDKNIYVIAKNNNLVSFTINEDAITKHVPVKIIYEGES